MGIIKAVVQWCVNSIRWGTYSTYKAPRTEDSINGGSVNITITILLKWNQVMSLFSSKTSNSAPLHMEQKPKSWHCLWSHLHFSYPLPPPSLFSLITSSHSSFTYCSDRTSLPSSTRSGTILGPGICICCFCPGILFSWTSPGRASLLRVGIYSHILFSRWPSKTTLFKLATFLLKIVYCYLPPLFFLWVLFVVLFTVTHFLLHPLFVSLY